MTEQQIIARMNELGAIARERIQHLTQLFYTN